MTYKQKYDTLIKESITRGWTKRDAPCYVEVHHIIPRCMGGSNDNDNLVALTAIEHYTAHKYLALIHPEIHGLTHAWWRMCHLQDGTPVPEDDYKEARERHAKLMSERFKGRPGKPCSDETKRKLSEHNKGKVIPREIVDRINKANTGKKRSDESKARMREAQKMESAMAARSKWIYITPNGEFSDYKEAAIVCGLNKHTLIYRCKNNSKGFSIKPTSHTRKNAPGRKRKYTYITPVGDFECYRQAARENNIKAVTLFYRCKKSIKGFSKVSQDEYTK